MKCPNGFHFIHSRCRRFTPSDKFKCPQRGMKKTDDSSDNGIWGSLGIEVPQELYYLFVEQ